MFARLLLVILFVAGPLAVVPARAEVYTWVDASGTVNVSNLAPPSGVHVTNVVHEIAQATAARVDAAREAARAAEVQTLSDRVRQLEDEAEFARRQAPPPLAYQPLQPPPVTYIVTPPAPPMQYAAAPARRGFHYSW